MSACPFSTSMSGTAVRSGTFVFVAGHRALFLLAVNSNSKESGLGPPPQPRSKRDAIYRKNVALPVGSYSPTSIDRYSGVRSSAHEARIEYKLDARDSRTVSRRVSREPSRCPAWSWASAYSSRIWHSLTMDRVGSFTIELRALRKKTCASEYANLAAACRPARSANRCISEESAVGDAFSR